MSSITIKTVLSCPECDSQNEETLPEDSCHFYYEYTDCHAIQKPRQLIVTYIATMVNKNVLLFKEKSC